MEILYTICWIKIVGQSEYWDPSFSGWYNILETNTIEKRHIKKGHIYPVFQDWFGLKCIQLPEFSEEANESGVSVKCR